MLKGENILCFSSKEWLSYSRTSKEYLMEIFSRQNRVIYVETTGSRRPNLNKRDLGRIGRRLARAARGPVKPEGIGEDQELYIYSPLAVPNPDSVFIQNLNQILLTAAFRSICRKFGFERPILWFYLPVASNLIGKLNEKLVVYHAVDEWSTYPGFRGELFQKTDRHLYSAADIVFAANPLLLESKRPLNPEIHFMPHGVNISDFENNVNPDAPLPPDIAAIKSPRIGMIGGVSGWIDWSIVRYAAEKHPEWSFVVIGDIGHDADLSLVKGLPNVRLLGPKKYSDLPDYYRGIDACMVPFIPNNHILYCCPTRFYEHLACGKPIVSTDFPAARAFGEDFVKIAPDKERFEKALSAAVIDSGEDIVRRRKALAAANTWQSRAEAMSDLIEKKMKEKGK